MKKIVISSYDDLKNPVYSGGGAKVVHEIAKRLSKKYITTVLTGTYKNAKDEVIDGVNYKRIGTDIFGHKIGQLFFHISITKQAIISNFDIWIESTMPPFTFSLVPIFTKKPVIAWLTMFASQDMKRKYFVNLRFIEIFLSRFYSLFIVSTEWAAKEIKILNNFAKIKIIPVGYDSFSESKSGKLDLNDYLLFIGRLEVNQKGLDLLIEALAIGNKNNKLIIAGQGSMKEEMKLKNLISKYNLESRIKLVGRSENEDKISLFKGAKAVVVPSRFETFCLVALETIAFQKPLICFDIPQLSWIPNNFAQKVKSFDLKKMSKMIDLVLLNNPKHLSKLKTRAFLKSFKWVNVAKEFERSVRIYI